MRNWLLLLGLPVSLIGAVGCVEEKASVFLDGGSPPPAAPKDAGAPPKDAGTVKRDAGTDAGRDAGMVRPSEGETLIENLGEPCEVDEDCRGSKPRCVQLVDVGIAEIEYPGGYCTAQCVADEECGETGACPSALAAKGNPFFAEFSVCTLRCEAQDECRDGYVCGVVAALGATINTCTPEVPGFAITPAGGSKLDAGSMMDAGTQVPSADAGPDARR